MASHFDITGRLAMVTGSSRGLGRALATTLADAGADVLLHGRDAAALEESTAEIEQRGGRVAGSLTFDVTSADETADAIAEATARYGTPDILVNNAGLQRRAPIQDFTVADWDALVATNLSSVFYVSRMVMHGMIARGSGKIVNVGSVQSLLARQTIAPYSATKGGVAQLTKGMAADLAKNNIQVNAISPGYFATDMNRALVDDPNFTAWVETRTPAGRWGSLSELSGTLLYLCSDASAFVSGQNLFVDGGMTAVL